jgi:hypothetical protein
VLTLEFTAPDRVKRHLLPILSLPFLVMWSARRLGIRILCMLGFLMLAGGSEALGELRELPLRYADILGGLGLVGLAVTISDTLSVLRAWVTGE